MKAAEIIQEYGGLLQYVFDWEAGLFTIRHNEYRLLPEIFIRARKALSKIRTELEPKT